MKAIQHEAMRRISRNSLKHRFIEAKTTKEEINLSTYEETLISLLQC